MDPLYCVLLGLAVFLEIFIESGRGQLTPYIFGFNDDFTIPDGSQKAKTWVQHMLHQEVFQLPEFHVGGPVGTHSIRKYASTHARKNGCSKDEKDIRGRWKKGKRNSDAYDDIELPFPDAKVAGKLCIGGPCKYVIKDGSGVTDAFLLQHVVPNIQKRFSADVALVLAKPLLWMIFPDGSTYLPETMRNRVRAAYENIRVLPVDENPVEKVMLVVTGFEGEVYLDEIGNENDRNHWRHANNRDQLLALHSQMTVLQRSVEDIKATQEEHQVDRRHEV